MQRVVFVAHCDKKTQIRFKMQKDGDYFGMSASGVAVWGDTHNGNQDIFGAPVLVNKKGKRVGGN